MVQPTGTAVRGIRTEAIGYGGSPSPRPRRRYRLRSPNRIRLDAEFLAQSDFAGHGSPARNDTGRRCEACRQWRGGEITRYAATDLKGVAAKPGKCPKSQRSLPLVPPLRSGTSR